jgi:hypothetical protein
MTLLEKSKLAEELLAPLFKEAGFNKRKLSWYRDFDETIAMVHWRARSSQSVLFYIEATVIFKVVPGVVDIHKLGFYDGHVRFKVELLVDDVGVFRKLLYLPDSDTDEKVREKLTKMSVLVRSAVIPWLSKLGTVNGVRELINHIDLLKQKSERSCVMIYPEGRQVLENPSID